jgi:hypothetical protein
MAFAGPVNAPSALNLITAVKVRFMEAYEDLYGGAAYKDWESFTYPEDPEGDLIYTIYAEPMRPLRQWYGDRPMSSTDFRYWTQAVRTFGDGMELDVDDLKDDGNPAKRQMYLKTAEAYAESAAALWPSLIAEAMVNSIGRIWLPDGQHIFDLHNFSINNSSLGTYRNYFANNTQGGNAAYPLTYGNLLALLKQGLTFKAPTGLDYPITYTELVVPAGSASVAARLTGFDRLSSGEVYGQTLSGSSAGGEVTNEIKSTFAPRVKVLANMPANTWSLINAKSKAAMPIALKKRQEITWQFTNPGGDIIAGVPAGDEGLVSEQVFNTNKSKYGPKARGEAFFRNWWNAAFCDGNSSPVTSLNIVS